jgi:hypothetical protein
MIFKLIMVVSLVVICYLFPSFSDSEYTNLYRLRENVIFSSLLIIILSIFVPGRIGIIICGIEWCLITCNFYLAFYWEARNALLIGAHYSDIQSIAFYSELAIIGIWLILGMNKIGAELHNYHNRISAHTNGIGNSEYFK